MTVAPSNKTLLITNKSKTSANGTVKQSDYATDMRTIEQWAKGVGGGPVSMSGPGETASPGGIVQQGAFEVVDSSVGGQAMLVGEGDVLLENNNPSGGILITDHGTGLNLEETSTTDPMQLVSNGGQGIVITSDSHDEPIIFITGENLANLDTPVYSGAAAFGFTLDCHIYTWAPPSGPWTLLI